MARVSHASGEGSPADARLDALESGSPWREENLTDVLGVPTFAPGGFTQLTVTKQLLYLCGGPGMEVLPGDTVKSISWFNQAAAVSLTLCFACLVIPEVPSIGAGEDSGTVVAVSNDGAAAGWAANTAKRFSLLDAEGGSGEFTNDSDYTVPVMAGLVQDGTTNATMRGYSAGNGPFNGFVKPRWLASGPGSITARSQVSGVVNVRDTTLCPTAVILNRTGGTS